MGMSCCFHGKAALPFSAMIMVECIEVGLTTISKAAMMKGMSNFVFVVYYNFLGTVILFPYFASQNLRRNRSPITCSLLSKLFVLGSIGICLLQTCAYAGINYTSPTLATAIGNLIPVITFLLAVILRMEKLDLRNVSSRAKSMGAIIAISGALVVTLYKGPPVLISQKSFKPSRQLLLQQSDWALGCLLLLVTCLSSSIGNIFQASIAKEYPDEVNIVFFYSLFGSIQSALLSFIMERNPSSWKLHHGIEIIAIVYAAVFVAVLRNGIVTWCLRERGPVFVAMYKPLGIVIAVAMGFVFLGDTLYLGSVIGAGAIVTGFYVVTWGQAKEKAETSRVTNVRDLDTITGQKIPLLQNMHV
ncbi:hypothetical protein Dimus_011280 [Dionaea muscipula]